MLANKGIVPIGLITTKRAMVDLKISFPKIFKNENKFCIVIDNISEAILYIKNPFTIKIHL